MVVRETSEARSTKSDVAGKLVLGVLALAVALVLTCRKWNAPPEAPWHPGPDSAATGQGLGLVLSWQSHDPDEGDTVRFDVFLGTDSPPSLVGASQADTTFSTTDVVCSTETQYYWRVIARDNHGDSAVGPLWQFTTAAMLLVTAPETGERLMIYSLDTITWTGGPTAARAALEAGGKPSAAGATRSASPLDAPDSTIVYRSTDDTALWARLGDATVPGQYVWQVSGPATESARVKVSVYALGGTITGTSGWFEVVDTLPPSAIDVTSPDSTSGWIIGSVHDVTWSGGIGGVDSSVIYFSADNGASWARQGSAAAPGDFSWSVPGPATDQARIEVRAYNLSGMTTGSSGTFRIVEPPYPDTVVATVAVGANPRALCWDAGDNRVFVSCYSDSALAVVDGNSNAVLTSIGVGSFPSAVLWNPRDNKVYATSETRNTVTIIDGATLAVIDTISVGQKPVAMCWNRTNNKVYVANKNDSSVTIVDGATNQVVATAAVGGSPTALAWSPVNNTVYVADFGTSRVTAIDGEDNTATPIVLSFNYPCAVVVDTADNEIYVAHQNDERVSVIDGASNNVMTSIPAGTQPWALAWNGTQNRVYCANSQAGTVIVINAANHSIIADVPVAAQPRALWWSETTDKLYAACYGGNSVAIIDGSSNAVLRTVTVGAKPSALCWNSQANKAYVANYDDGTVSVLGAGARERR